MLRHILGGWTIVLLLASSDSHADVRLAKKPIVGRTIYIVNTISKADANAIAQHVSDFEREGMTVLLDSNGGDANSAMQIGQVVRMNDGLVIVPQGAKCYSSCALIYVAGVTRINLGVIGLHRPYFAAAPQSREEIERHVPLMLRQLKAYVQKMGLTDNFYQEMVNTEPSNLKLYRGEEILRLVPVTDPTYDEVETSYEARNHGISTSEYRRREQEAKNCYQRYLDNPYCKSAILWGLSEGVTREREKRANEKCKDKIQLGLWKTMKRRVRLGHPTWLQYLDCRRNVMLGR